MQWHAVNTSLNWVIYFGTNPVVAADSCESVRVHLEEEGRVDSSYEESVCECVVHYGTHWSIKGSLAHSQYTAAIFKQNTPLYQKIYPLRRRGIPKSSRADMPDACISCSFLLC